MKEKDNIQDLNKELEGFAKLQSLKGKQSFSVPDSYFDNLEDNIMSKIAQEDAPAPKIQINTKKVLMYAAAASIVALFIFIALRSGNQEANQPQIADQPTEQIDNQNQIVNKEDIPKQNNKEEIREQEHIDKVELINNNAIAIENNTPTNKVYNNEETPQNKKANPNYIDENTQSDYDIANNDMNNYSPNGSNTTNGQAVSGVSTNPASSNYSPALARKAVQKDLYLGENRCSNKPVLLSALVKDIDNLKYLWSTDDTTANIIVRKSGNYWVKIYDIKNNLLGSDTVKVTIVAKPRPNLGEDKSICNYESILISSGCKNKNYSYQWSISDATTPEIYLSDLQPGTFDIILTIMSCADTVNSTLLLTVKDCNLKIPNVITPNGDGRNDQFVIKGLDHYPGSQLHIMDRNGQIVFESMDYQNDWEAANIPAGTYFYRLQLNDSKNSEKNGTITIIRK
jgi:gliding motility-associated-like protein